MTDGPFKGLLMHTGLDLDSKEIVGGRERGWPCINRFGVDEMISHEKIFCYKE